MTGAAELLAGCSSSTAPPSSGTMSLGIAIVGGAGKPVTAAAATISLARARFLLREIELDTAVGDSCSFEVGPEVVELALPGGRTEIAVRSVPPWTYDEVEFDVHRLDPDDPVDQQALARPEFADFNTESRPSMIIEGTTTDPVPNPSPS
jgi:hypothetical protein